MATITELIDIAQADMSTNQGLALVDMSKQGTPILHYVTKYVSVVPGAGPVRWKCWLDDGDFVIANEDGQIPEDPTRKIVVVDTTIREDGYASSSAITRGEGGSVTKTERGIEKLNARETIAMNVMVNILKTLEDPIEISNTAIDMLVGKSFRIAQTFLDTASAKRDELGENITETTDAEDPVESIANKLDEISSAIGETIAEKITSIADSLSTGGDVVSAITAKKEVEIVGGAVDAVIVNDEPLNVSGAVDANVTNESLPTTSTVEFPDRTLDVHLTDSWITANVDIQYVGGKSVDYGDAVPVKIVDNNN